MHFITYFHEETIRGWFQPYLGISNISEIHVASELCLDVFLFNFILLVATIAYVPCYSFSQARVNIFLHTLRCTILYFSLNMLFFPLSPSKGVLFREYIQLHYQVPRHQTIGFVLTSIDLLCFVWHIDSFFGLFKLLLMSADTEVKVNCKTLSPSTARSTDPPILGKSMVSSLRTSATRTGNRLSCERPWPYTQHTSKPTL